MVKNLLVNAGDTGLIPGLGKSPRVGNNNALQYFCLEDPHGQKSLAGYSPRSLKESDISEHPSTHTAHDVAAQ